MLIFIIVAFLLTFVPNAVAKCPSAVFFAVGTYTGQPWLPSAAGEGIILAKFENGVLYQTASFSPGLVGENPSYLAVSPPKIYATNENAPEGALVQISFPSKPPFLSSKSLSAMKAGTTHVSVLVNSQLSQANFTTRRIILTANFGGAVTSFIKTRTSFSFADIFTVPPRFAAQKRDPSLSDFQGAPHPHMVLPYRKGVIVPDLGSDIVWYLRVSRRTGKLSEISRLRLSPGDGPRHAALHPQTGTIYVVNEISLSVVVLRRRSCGRKAISVCQRRRLLKVGKVDGASAAAIRVSANGMFLYASVRFPGEDLGKIVGFRLDATTGDITKKIGEWSSQGVHPRDFFLVEKARDGGSCKSFVAVVNRDSDNLVLVERNAINGRMSKVVAHNIRIVTPTSVTLY